MKKLKLTPSAYNRGEVLTKAQLKKVMGGDGSGVPCTYGTWECGIYGHCVNFYCDNSFGSGGGSCQVNNGGCQIDRVCVYDNGGIMCI